MAVELEEVVKEEGDGPLVIRTLELDKFVVCATVVLTAPTRTRTWALTTTEPCHPLFLLLPRQQEATCPRRFHFLVLVSRLGEGRDSSGRRPFVI